MQPNLQRGFDELRENVERAASSVLGDEASSLRFAQEELDSLTRELQAEQLDSEGIRPKASKGRDKDRVPLRIQIRKANGDKVGEY